VAEGNKLTTTYDELQEAWKRELRNNDLQPLKQGFFKDLAAYTKRLREAQRNLDGKSLKAEVIEEELGRLEKLLSQLLDRRLRKIESQTDLYQTMELALVEKQVYQAASSTHRDFKKLKDEILQGREPTTSVRADQGPLLIRFIKDVPSIIGVDLKTHGPFQREDIATLPRENAESLIRQGTAVEVRASDSR
jgi:DNA replication initiation complex subunit (GINS family)